MKDEQISGSLQKKLQNKDQIETVFGAVIQ
jgi:hypothetical protein